MDVLKITPRGYCHGVVEAIRAAKQTAKARPGEKIRMLGYLVHNTHVTDELQENGIELVDSDNRLEGLDTIDGGTVIFTAHGVSPAVKAKAAARGLNMVDATCSDVVVTHDLVKDLVERGYDVVYIGRRGHPEPEGVIGEAPGNVHLVQVVKELAHKPAYLVDTVKDIKPEWLQGKTRVGVTSGASTPTQLTRQVIEYLEAI